MRWKILTLVTLVLVGVMGMGVVAAELDFEIEDEVDAGQTVEWSSSQDVTIRTLTPDLLTVNESGEEITALRSGQGEIRVSHDGESEVYTVNISERAADRIELTVDRDDVIEETDTSYEVDLVYPDGDTRDVTDEATVSTSNQSVGSARDGTFTAGTSGTTNLTAEWQGLRVVEEEITVEVMDASIDKMPEDGVIEDLPLQEVTIEGQSQDDSLSRNESVSTGAPDNASRDEPFTNEFAPFSSDLWLSSDGESFGLNSEQDVIGVGETETTGSSSSSFWYVVENDSPQLGMLRLQDDDPFMMTPEDDGSISINAGGNVDDNPGSGFVEWDEGDRHWFRVNEIGTEDFEIIYYAEDTENGEWTVDEKTFTGSISEAFSEPEFVTDSSQHPVLVEPPTGGSTSPWGPISVHRSSSSPTSPPDDPDWESYEPDDWENLDEDSSADVTDWFFRQEIEESDGSETLEFGDGRIETGTNSDTFEDFEEGSLVRTYEYVPLDEPVSEWTVTDVQGSLEHEVRDPDTGEDIEGVPQSGPIEYRLYLGDGDAEMTDYTLEAETESGETYVFTYESDSVPSDYEEDDTIDYWNNSQGVNVSVDGEVESATGEVIDDQTVEVEIVQEGGDSAEVTTEWDVERPLVNPEVSWSDGSVLYYGSLGENESVTQPAGSNDFGWSGGSELRENNQDFVSSHQNQWTVDNIDWSVTGNVSYQDEGTLDSTQEMNISDAEPVDINVSVPQRMDLDGTETVESTLVYENGQEIDVTTDAFYDSDDQSVIRVTGVNTLESQEQEGETNITVEYSPDGTQEVFSDTQTVTVNEGGPGDEGVGFLSSFAGILFSGGMLSVLGLIVGFGLATLSTELGFANEIELRPQTTAVIAGGLFWLVGESGALGIPSSTRFLGVILAIAFFLYREEQKIESL